MLLKKIQARKLAQYFSTCQRKAFDRVWHEGLIYKLECKGISGNPLTLVRNYLKERKQRVVLNGRSSEWATVSAGVPQGSVLGPLFFLIYFFYINIKYYNICYILLYFNYYATLPGRCQEEQKTMSTPWPTHENTQLNQQLNKHLQNGTHTIRY